MKRPRLIASFDRANGVIKDYYRSQIPATSPDYMLFSFYDGALREVIYKPDEWGPFNVVLAEHLLSERGVPVNEARRDGEERQRLSQMRKPEKLDGLWPAIGYLSTLAGGVLGLVIGLYLLRGRKTLPNGERTFIYEKSDRRQDLIMLLISGIVLTPIGIAIMRSDYFTATTYSPPFHQHRWLF